MPGPRQFERADQQKAALSNCDIRNGKSGPTLDLTLLTLIPRGKKLEPRPRANNSGSPWKEAAAVVAKNNNTISSPQNSESTAMKDAWLDGYVAVNLTPNLPKIQISEVCKNYSDPSSNWNLPSTRLPRIEISKIGRQTQALLSSRYGYDQKESIELKPYDPIVTQRRSKKLYERFVRPSLIDWNEPTQRLRQPLHRDLNTRHLIQRYGKILISDESNHTPAAELNLPNRSEDVRSSCKALDDDEFNHIMPTVDAHKALNQKTEVPLKDGSDDESNRNTFSKIAQKNPNAVNSKSVAFIEFSSNKNIDQKRRSILVASQSNAFSTIVRPSDGISTSYRDRAHAEANKFWPRQPDTVRVSTAALLRPLSRIQSLQAMCDRLPEYAGRRIQPLIAVFTDTTQFQHEHEKAAREMEEKEQGRLEMLGRYDAFVHTIEESAGEVSAKYGFFSNFREGLELLASELASRQCRRPNVMGQLNSGLRAIVGDAAWESVHAFLEAAGVPGDEEEFQIEHSLSQKEGNASQHGSESSEYTHNVLKAEIALPEPESEQPGSICYESSNSVRGGSEAISHEDIQRLPTNSADVGIKSQIEGAVSLPDILRRMRNQSLSDVSDIQHLNCTNSGLRCQGIISLIPLLNASKCLLSLYLGHNGILERGGSALADVLIKETFQNLQTLVLEHNTLGRSAEKITDAIYQQCQEIQTLSIASNGLSDQNLGRAVKALSGHANLASLDIGRNSIGRSTCESLEMVLGDCEGLTSLNCEWSEMRGSAAVSFARSLALSTALTRLNLAWNGFGDAAPAEAMSNFIGMPRCRLQHLNLAHNRIGAPAAFLFANRLEHNTSLETLILDGNPLGAVGVRQIMMASMTAPPSDSLEDDEKKDESRPKLSVKDCAVHAQGSMLSFNPSEPAGEYLLTMSKPFSQGIVERLLRIEALGRGMFDRSRMTLDGAPFHLERFTDPDSVSSIPRNGQLFFIFEVGCATKQHSTGGQGLPQHIYKSLFEFLHADGGEAESGLSKLEFLNIVMTSEPEVSLHQARSLLNELVDEKDRVGFVAQVYHKINEPGAQTALLTKLSAREAELVSRILGESVLKFTPRNPTGRYHLDLLRKEEREVALQLFECKARHYAREKMAKTVLSIFKNARDGSQSKALDRVWRNCLWGGKPFPWFSTLSIPNRDMLDLDFVQILRPQDLERSPLHAVSNEDWASFLSKEILDFNPLNIITAFRALSDMAYFKVSQVEELLHLLQTNPHRRKTLATPPLSPESLQVLIERKQLQGNVNVPDESRIEVAVIAFSRTIDFHGYYGYWGLYRRAFNGHERRILARRLGAANAWFDHCMAVDHYELDLSIQEERWIVEELVRMASIEPGENCVKTTLDDIDFVIPTGWKEEVPHKGIFSTFYCREQSTIDTCLTTARQTHPGSIPESFHSQAKSGWVHGARLRTIRDRLAAAGFASAEECFNTMDIDGGGTLSRREVALGLLQVGVWLHPSELANFVEFLDSDNDHLINLAEFCTFWHDYG